jgi:hypothetical protein
LVGVLTLVFYRSLAPTEATTSNITVIDNNQTITTTQDTNITTITRTSEVNVTDYSATLGYTLTATLTSNLPTGSNIQIYPDPDEPNNMTDGKTSTCTSSMACDLSSSSTAILTSNNDLSGIASGETTKFKVIITLPASPNIGAYTVDIAYDETPTTLPPITNPAQACTNTNDYTATGQESAGLSTDNSAITVDLDQNMIPIIYTGNTTTPQWQTIDQTNPSWYDYTTQKWANAITVTTTSLSKYQNTSGVTVDETDVLGYWVYIPRYRYQVFRCNATDPVIATPTNFNIKFENQTATDYEKAYPATNNDWATHPAFTFGTQELNGLWVGKFETTGSITAPTIKPNLKSQISQYIGVQFDISGSIGVTKPTGGNGTTITQNTHNLATTNSTMLKNDQWGAIAYLSASTYGAGVNNVQINAARSNTLQDGNGKTGYGITGCGPSTNGINSQYTITDTATTGAVACTYSGTSHSYQTATGQLASSTNNVYGIYDLSGGTWEYVMGNHNATNTTYMATMPSANYFDNYPVPPFATRPSWSSSSDEEYYNNDICTWSTCGGQALHETKITQSVSSSDQSWGSDYSYFVDSSTPWFERGGYSGTGMNGGVFASHHNFGSAFSSVGFRVVVGAF